MSTNYIRPFGLSLEGPGGAIDVAIDTTNDPEFAANNAGLGGNVAGDTISVGPLPAGTLLTGAIIRTDVKFTGNIDIGITGALTLLANGATPSTTVGNCIAGIPATVCAALDNATYLIVNLKSANTTGGKLQIKVPCTVIMPFNGITM